MGSNIRKKWPPERILRGFRWAGMAIALIGLAWVVDTAWFLAHAEQAEATVVGWETVKSRTKESNGFTSNHTYWHAIVQFEDAHGGAQRATSPRALNERVWEDGAVVPVYYDAEDPTQVFIQDTVAIWFPPGIIVLLGGFVLALAHLILILLRLNAQRKAEEVADIVAQHIAKKET